MLWNEALLSIERESTRLCARVVCTSPGLFGSLVHALSQLARLYRSSGTDRTARSGSTPGIASARNDRNTDPLAGRGGTRRSFRARDAAGSRLLRHARPRQA